MSRAFGSVNKASLNITQTIRNAFTQEDCEYAAERIRALMHDPDPDVAFKAIKLFLERFSIAADKIIDQLEASKVNDIKHYNALIKELRDDFNRDTPSIG